MGNNGWRICFETHTWTTICSASGWRYNVLGLPGRIPQNKSSHERSNLETKYMHHLPDSSSQVGI
jgi:hypothetical protein